MKRLVKKLVGAPAVNAVLRRLLRSVISTSASLSKSLITYVPVSGIVKIEMEGHLLSFYANGDDALVNKLYYSHGWEENVIQWFCKICSSRPYIIDAGANIGLFSLLAAKRNPDATVHAFEPNPSNAIRLKRNVGLNGLDRQIHCHPTALGNSLDPVTFFLPVDDRISDVSSVYRSHTVAFNDFTHKQIEVPCTTLERFCAEAQLSPQVIKIDVELYELQVFHGMGSILSRDRPIIFCEIFNDEVKRKLNPALDAELQVGYTDQLQEFLQGAGYYFYLIVPAGILHVENLKLSPIASMYLLSPVKFKRPFYLQAESDAVLEELGNA